MDTGDRANRFIEQWETNIYPDPQHWDLQLEGGFYPDRESLDEAVVSICKGAFQVTICGENRRYPGGRYDDPNHTPSGRAEVTLNWESAKWGGNWEIISIDTKR